MDYFQPEQYKVYMLNDEYTFPEFILIILGDHFGIYDEEADNLLLEIQKNGRGLAGSYTYDIAMTKAKDVQDVAFEFGFPLRCILEPDFSAILI